MEKNYFIGLDMGTESVGWAVTDEDYNLLKARGHDMWGSYLFDEAQTAAGRRGFRTARRRLARVRQRINLLQSLFAEEMAKKDPLFFIRLNNSALWKEDKDGRIIGTSVLFNDDGYKDKDYFAQYPTIYHLRLALMKDQIDDIRLLYIAVHHIIKNRGNFLFEGQEFSASDTNVVKEKFHELNEFLSELRDDSDEDNFEISLEKLDGIIDALKDKQLSKTDKSRKISELFGNKKNKTVVAVAKLISGCKASVKDLFALEEDPDDIKSFSLADNDFETGVMPKLYAAVGDDADMVMTLKAVYDWSVLCAFMGEEKYISAAKVKIYDKHKADLKKLKDYVATNCPEKKALIFRRQDKVNNYAAYVGMDKGKGFGKCAKDEFYKFLKNEIKISAENILRDIDNGDFLSKQVSTDNGVLPYQLHLAELKAILANAEKYFAFLNESDGEHTVSQKIISLLTFRIPYYVGPLNSQNSRFAWAVRNPGYDRVPVTPWNFDKVIDKDASEEKFIKNMTRKCSYLIGQDVLPASSLLYTEATFLNELNNLTINGIKSAEAKKLIYGYAQEHKKITLKRCLKLLQGQGILPPDCGTEVFGGTDGDFKNSLSTYNDLAFLGDKRETHSEMCEEIITWITLISDKNRLERRIRNKYGKILSDDEIKRFKSLNYTKWGRLSAELLNGIRSEKLVDANGEYMTVIKALREKNRNLSDLLMSKDCGFVQAIEAYNKDNVPSGKVTYKTVEELYCSPSVKRSIWRAVELVREIVKIRGYAPKKIFIEMARGGKAETPKGSRTVSRKDSILNLYKNIKDEEREWIKEIESQPDSKFSSDKLVMYYRQLGRCMYSGEPLSLEDVFNTKKCDIDHIFPRSKLKDDSLDNRVLVLIRENRRKKDVYPINTEIVSKMKPFWRELREKGLISETKYSRLIRTNELTQDELKGFINRQLVETRQSTKAAAGIFKEMLPGTEIVYAKASNADEFKAKNGIIKIRELNDLHHAKDAYINIVVGNVFNVKFTHNPYLFQTRDSYNLETLFDRDIKGAWKVEDRQRIVDTANKNTARVVFMQTEGEGKLFDATIKPAKANANLTPLKAKGAWLDTSKYGGYDSTTTAYFMLVRSKDKKGRPMLTLEAYTRLMEKMYPDNSEAKEKFCREQCGLIQPEILLDKIKINTLFKINGSYACLRGRTGERILWNNANQLFLEDKLMQYLKPISKYMQTRRRLKKQDILPNEKEITKENNLCLYDALLDKLSSDIYAGLSVAGQAPFLRKHRDDFIALDLKAQCETLMQVLNLMQCNAKLADLTALNGVKNAGNIRTSKNISELSAKIIYQSPTGYYRKAINLSDFL